MPTPSKQRSHQPPTNMSNKTNNNPTRRPLPNTPNTLLQGPLKSQINLTKKQPNISARNIYQRCPLPEGRTGNSNLLPQKNRIISTPRVTTHPADPNSIPKNRNEHYHHQDLYPYTASYLETPCRGDRPSTRALVPRILYPGGEEKTEFEPPLPRRRKRT